MPIMMLKLGHKINNFSEVIAFYKINKKYLLTFFFSFSAVFLLFAAQFTDEVFDPRIKTVQLYREGWNLSYPVLILNRDNRLILKFDLLDNSPESYWYTFVHCDKDWNESNIFISDYLTGFNEDQIEDYRPSFNTKVNYYHYQLRIPNDRMGIKLSGNYVIKVYRAGEHDRPAFTKRFMVAENAVLINASIKRPQPGPFYNTGQQAEIVVGLGRIGVRDPYNEIFTFIVRNGNFNETKGNLRPDLVGSNELRYNLLSNENIFYGGNEYRFFDIRNIRYPGENVRKIDYLEGRYHAFLVLSENREFKPYFYWQDFNGKYYVAVHNGRDMDVEADYIYVYFTLPSGDEVAGGEMYVSGAFNNWAFTRENRMTYDRSRGQYQCTMLMKQGWYNYEYIFLRNGAKAAPPSFFEGNHYETENDYLIFVYYRNPRDRYDRLVGFAISNSSKREGL